MQGIVIGAGHGIGLALVKLLLKKYPNITLHATYHNQTKAKALRALHSDHLTVYQCDITKETEIQSVAKKIKKPIDILIITVGFLHSDTLEPEKSLKDVDKDHLLKYFETNAIVTPLIAKHFKNHFSSTHRSVFAAISARVGSIADNQLGGWYGYRASKAALNMFIKTIAIELKRAQKQTVVLALHPGTTKTDLAEPFLSHIQHQVFTADETAENLLQVIEKATLEQSGQFRDWQNQLLPW